MASSNGEEHGPVVNSSAIADLSSVANDIHTSPLAQLLGKKKESTAPEHFAKRVTGTSEPAAEGDYVDVYDVVRAYLETGRGEQGTEEQRAAFAGIVQELVAAPDGLDIAALAFLATVSGGAVSEDTRAQITALVRQRMNDSGFHEDMPRLDDIYSKFVSDAYRHRPAPQHEPISVLDSYRFAHRWLHAGSLQSTPVAHHWEIRHLNSTPVDSMSPQFEVHGTKCVLRFRRSYMLSNGEAWAGLWLHNVSSGRKVLDIKFALVLSNVAYPTVYQVEVIKPARGIRPSQGVGVKLFASLDRLVRRSGSSSHPIIEYNSIRASIISL